MMQPPGTGLRLTSDMARIYGKRGGLARATTHQWYVEGEAVTTAAVAERLGITLNAAGKRIRRIRRKGKPITWSALKLEKQP